MSVGLAVAPPKQELELSIEKCRAVHEIPDDVVVRAAASMFIGAQIKQVVEVSSTDPSDQEFDSLHHALTESRTGNPEAIKMLKMNIKTDLSERILKTGNVSEVPLKVDDKGNIFQFGQTLRSIQANSLTYLSDDPAMVRRIEAETLNTLRTEFLQTAGYLQDFSMIVFSMVPDDIPIEQAKSLGFFAETMSVSIQRTGLSTETQDLCVETAFVSGTSSDSSQRFDIDTVIELYSRLGVDISSKSVEEILATPLLVPNDLISNGVVDIVQMYDQIIGDNVFFGSQANGQDYDNFKKFCKQRESGYDPHVELILEELLDSGQTNDPVSTCRILNKLSAKYAIGQALVDESIDLRVFGDQTARSIEQARQAMMSSDYSKVVYYIKRAEKMDTSSSCPNGSRKMAGESNSEASETLDSNESCSFISKRCPKCDKRNVLTKVTATHIKGSCGCVVKK